MNGRPSRQTFALRQRPLALCLACALGIGATSGTAAAGSAKTTSADGFARPQTPGRITGPADLPAGSVRRILWEQALANPPPPRPATTIPVTNCNDSGAGSLRDAMNTAVDGDTIDMTALTCSTITLSTGVLDTDADNLTINGPKYGVEIDASGIDTNNINHFGAGTLTLSKIGVTNGYYTGSVGDGGCIWSLGSVELSNSYVEDCTVKYAADGSTVRGGGIWALYDVGLDHSVVSGNRAINVASSNGTARGGGVYAVGAFYSTYSSVLDNGADSSTYLAFGGGVQSHGVGLKYSTIANNYSNHNIGGIAISSPSTALNTILNTTISGNTAKDGVGGAFSSDPLIVLNSTISFNDQGSVGSGSYSLAAGLTVNDSLTLKSSIISANLDQTSGKYFDLGGPSGNTVSGQNNLITNTLITPPGDTILGTDPQLLPLAYNGGPTQTHALSPTSPAIDTGYSSTKYLYDQRGPGYPRVVGANADIGAFEGDFSDVIFANGFD